jgi:FKBP-type peptidyl-prolyl cis-trans isomerase
MLGACSASDNIVDEADIATTTFAASLGVDLTASTKLPSGVYYRDLVVGTGIVVASGQQLSVRYTGWFPNGTQFDSNANTNPYSFVLGTRAVIDGWDNGLPGMKVGGKRQLIIPPSQAYGAAGRSGIPGNSILVFTVDVLGAQ